ncbi:glycosyltransferase [Burkholderia multivorans]|uniref:glycosyltransferase n=1 Tax=Burkholderia multivorans TaxID=87883 RepID=UPI0021C160E5|nr:glycosyltransferase [Burkholderia multivorans]
MHIVELTALGTRLTLDAETNSHALNKELSQLTHDHFDLQRLFANTPIRSVLIVGAGAGLFPLYFAAALPNAKVCVLEAVQKPAKLLHKNAKQNGLSNIEVLRGCYAETTAAEKTLYLLEANDSVRTSLDYNTLDYVTATKTVPTFDMRDILAAFDLSHFDVVFLTDDSPTTHAVTTGLAFDNCGVIVGTLPTTLDPLKLKIHLKKSGIRAFLRGSSPADFLEEKTEDKILLSIVLPIYNVATYLPQCFESLLTAAPPCTEFLAINDGSTDNSAEVVQEWAARHPNIRLINKPNGGCASARSAGLQQAAGEYVTFIDPDDWLFPDSLTRLCRAAVLGSTDIAQGGFAKYYESSGHSELVNEDWIASDFHRLVMDQGNIRRLLTLQPTIWRRIYRRRFLLENGLDFYHQIRRFDDLPFQFEALSVCRSFKAIPDFIYNYRLQRPGQDVAINDDRLYVHFDIFHLLDTFVRRLGAQQVIAQLLRVKLNTHGWAVSQIRDEFKGKYRDLARRDIETTRQMLDTAEFNKIIAERKDYRMLVSARKKGLFATFAGRASRLREPSATTPSVDEKSTELDNEVTAS